jgi:anthranilate/para-aminobenzoate synthase component I
VVHLERFSNNPSSEAVCFALRAERDLVWLDDPGRKDIVVWGARGRVEAGPGFLERARSQLRPARPPAGVPFAGGLVGYIGYEAGRYVERMPAPRPSPLPELCLRRYDGALVRDDTGWFAAGDLGFLERARAVMAAAVEPPPSSPPLAVERGDDPAVFLDGVAEALRAIRRGDYYQVNLSRRLEFQGVDDVMSLYRRLRRRTAEYGALVQLPGGGLVSNSPELFVRVEQGQVTSRPIKGTRPLGQRDQLLKSPKERAELTMIVDLVRNDLGRVCEPGSVTAGARVVTSLPTLLHAEQTVRGRLAGGRDALDLVAASFPPGSVTGAPKVMAMQAIAALEPVARGPYTGCVGYFADGGDAQLSVAIRTASVLGSRAWAHVGCGIVADSDPVEEFHESEVKAQALREALVGLNRPR